jgi:formamidopyrimidine-DNA glycosylase
MAKGKIQMVLHLPFAICPLKFFWTMPELPEVETVSQGLKRRALGRRIIAVEVFHSGVIVGPPEQFAAEIEGRAIVSVRRKGKVLALELSAESGPPRHLLVRLGMTGRFTVAACEAPREPHTHVLLRLGEREELRFRDARRFGRLRSCSCEELEAVWVRLGPDAQEATEEEFLNALRGHRGALKSWLMNQRLLAGLGNIYADESLFLARIHPLAQPGRLSLRTARRLFRAVRKVLDTAVKLQGTSFRDYVDIEGRPGNYEPRLRVYQRTGEPCRRCGRAIRRIVIGGRSSHFCPSCQPRPRHVKSSDK